MNRFDRAINKLVKAFFEGNLAKADSQKCAVGNMCDEQGEWGYVFMTEHGRQIINENKYIGIAKETIDKTGYSWQELSQVEKAFEQNTTIIWLDYQYFDKSEIMEDQYNGLMAVVDVLCEIEGVESSETKKLFDYQSLLPINYFELPSTLGRKDYMILSVYRLFHNSHNIVNVSGVF